jgi:hypothetical protein
MQHEIRVVEKLTFVTKLSVVPQWTQGQDGRVSEYLFVLFLERVWHLCKRERASSSTLEGAHNTALLVQELRKQLQDRHGFAADATSASTVCSDTPNVLETLVQFEQTATRAKTTNKFEECDKKWTIARSSLSGRKTSSLCCRNKVSSSGRSGYHSGLSRPCPCPSPVCGIVCRVRRNGPLKWMNTGDLVITGCVNFGDPGNGTSCEKKFNLSHRKCQDYRGTRFYTGDTVLVIKRWLNRVEEDVWTPGVDTSRPPVSMLTLTHHGHLCLCWWTPASCVTLVSNSRTWFLQHLSQLHEVACGHEERDSEVLRSWDLVK